MRACAIIVALSFLGQLAVADSAQETQSGADPVSSHTPEMFNETIYAAIEDHLTARLGEVETVLHEKVSPDIHVDIIPIPPTTARDSWILATAGMSYRDMAVPPSIPNADFWKRAELSIQLPGNWFGETGLDPANLEDEALYAPIRLLKQLARYPHSNATAFAPTHTINLREPIAPSSEMSAVVFYWPHFLEEGEDIVKVPDNPDVNLYAVYPIYEAERAFAVENGSEALLKLLSEAGAMDTLDFARPPVVNE